MAEHARSTVETKLPIYFCDQHSRWQLRLNTRPRETLQWQTPAQALDTTLVATTS